MWRRCPAAAAGWAAWVSDGPEVNLRLLCCLCEGQQVGWARPGSHLLQLGAAQVLRTVFADVLAAACPVAVESSHNGGTGAASQELASQQPLHHTHAPCSRMSL